MTEQAIIPRNGAVEPVDFDRETIDLIKQTVAIGVSDVELQLFLYTARRTGLDPLARQIYAIKRKTRDGYKMVIQTGIDGYRVIAHRTGQCAGIDDPTFTEDGNVHPVAAHVTVWRMVQGVRCPFSATARWKEYAPSGNDAWMWDKMPYNQNGKCAEALALRKAFPAELSGLYTDDEMAQADNPPRVVDSAHAPPANNPVSHGPFASEPAPRKGKVITETGEIIDPNDDDEAADAALAWANRSQSALQTRTDAQQPPPTGDGLPNATEAQIKYIYKLIEQKHGIPDYEADQYCADQFGGLKIAQLSKQVASEFIGSLNKKEGAPTR